MAQGKLSVRLGIFSVAPALANVSGISRFHFPRLGKRFALRIDRVTELENERATRRRNMRPHCPPRFPLSCPSDISPGGNFPVHDNGNARSKMTIRVMGRRGSLLAVIIVAALLSRRWVVRWLLPAVKREQRTITKQWPRLRAEPCSSLP